MPVSPSSAKELVQLIQMYIIKFSNNLTPQNQERVALLSSALALLSNNKTPQTVLAARKLYDKAVKN